ncbi:MAG TPA: hypothetical protein VK972_08510, partial [Wenzhouxiangella sp.]|nr:hypothetical protein [Wenzhouxiangella sp.]
MAAFPNTLRPLLMLLAGLAVLVGCSAGPGEREQDKPHPLLLISIDGFRHDYIERFDSPALDRMIREGF